MPNGERLPKTRLVALKPMSRRSCSSCADLPTSCQRRTGRCCTSAFLRRSKPFTLIQNSSRIIISPPKRSSTRLIEFCPRQDHLPGQVSHRKLGIEHSVDGLTQEREPLFGGWRHAAARSELSPRPAFSAATIRQSVSGTLPSLFCSISSANAREGSRRPLAYRLMAAWVQPTSVAKSDWVGPTSPLRSR